MTSPALDWPRSGVTALVALAAASAGLPGGPAFGGEPGHPVVVATVGGEKIYQRDVDRMLRRVIGDRQPHADVLPVLQAQVLSEIVNRHLVLAYAHRTGSGPGEAEIDRAVDRFQTRMAARGEPVDALLEAESMTAADLRRQIEWQMTWERFTRRYVTEKRARSYFEAHRRELDGTEIAVSHILLIPDVARGAEGIGQAVRDARGIRQAILSGAKSFAEAAQEYSQAASGPAGGSVGFIRRHGAMVEAFSRTAFALAVGEVSQPVVTPFGVDLIRVDDVRPGGKTMDQVRAEIHEGLQRELLGRLARYERQFTQVQFTGLAPHFQPGTHDLVLPERPRAE